jgi:arginine utilization protein RocB
MFYTKLKQFVKDEFITGGFWFFFPPIETIHHKGINDRLDKIEKEHRKTIRNCINKDCPHHNKEALTHCESDPFECEKYKSTGGK